MKTKEFFLCRIDGVHAPFMRFWGWVFNRLFDLNLKMGWLNNYNNRVHDEYGAIDTLGSMGDIGKLIYTSSTELEYIETINFGFVKIHLVYA